MPCLSKSSRSNVRLTVDFHRAADAAECSSRSTGAHPREFACYFSCVASESFFDSVFERGPLLSTFSTVHRVRQISFEFQPWVESPRSLRCTRGRYKVRRLRRTMLIHWKILQMKYCMHDALVTCFVSHHVWIVRVFLLLAKKGEPQHADIPSVSILSLSCLELSAFSCCSREKVIRSTQTFRPFRSSRYQRSSLPCTALLGWILHGFGQDYCTDVE